MGIKRKRPTSCSFQPVFAVTIPKPDDAKRCSVALFGVRPRGDDFLDQGGGRFAAFCCPVDDSRRRPLGVGAMRLGHMLKDSRVVPFFVATSMRINAAIFEKDLDCGGREPGADLFTAKLEGHAVEVVVEHHVVVNIHPGFDDFGVNVSFPW